MIEDETDEEFIDDPIRLFDFEQDRVFCCKIRKGNIGDASHEDDIRFNKNRSDYEETVNSYKSNSSILPVTFFDIESNVELLNQCRPLIVKLVDCERFPSYHKWKMNVRDYSSDSDQNLNKSDLQEADCIVILSSDENEDDLIFKQTTLEDNLTTTVGNKKFSKLGSVSKNDTILEKNLVYDTINSYQNNKVIDLKRDQSNKLNQGIIDLKESQKNIISNAKSDNETKLITDNQHSYKDIHDDRMNTYARVIDKAYKKLTSRDIETPFKEIKTRKTGKPDCLVDNTKINCSDLVDSAKNKFNGKKCNNKEELLKSKIVSKVKNLISEENKGNNVFNKEMQTLERTIGNNNGSSSPLLPCPSKTKRSEMNGIHITQNTPLPFYTKHKINKNICKDQLFTASRVIPHYHHETYETQKYKPFNLNQNISKNTTVKTGSVQTNIERVSCEVNDMNQSLSKQCNKNKRTVLVEPNVRQINNITHNNHSISKTNHISSNNHMTHLCCSQVNLSQKQTACNLNREKSMNSGVNMINNPIFSPSLDATKGNSNPIPIGNSIPILLDRQPKEEHYNNYITPTFPIQRVESNRCNSHSNDLTFQGSSVSLANDHPSQNICQSNIHPNNTYSLQHSLSNMSNSTKTVTVYEDNLSPSFYTIPLQLTPINLLPEYRNDDSGISSTQFQHNYINGTENIDRHINSMNRKSNSNVNRKTAIASVIAKGPDVNQNASNAVENTKHSAASEVMHKYPYLKQCLERSPLLKNKPTNMNNEKRKCVNTASRNLDKILNKGYSPPILPIPTYQKTFEILAKFNLYDFDRGFSQPDLSDNNCIPSSRNFYVLEKTACKRKMNDVENVSRNITIDEYKKRMTGDSIRK